MFCSVGTATVSDWVTVVTGLFGANDQYAESEGTSTTTSTTYQQKLRLTTPSIPAGDYRISYSYEVRNDAGDKERDVQVEVDDTTQIAEDRSSTNIVASGSGFLPTAGFKVLTLTAAVHNIDIDFRSTAAGGTAEIRRARLHIWRVNP